MGALLWDLWDAFWVVFWLVSVGWVLTLRPRRRARHRRALERIAVLERELGIGIPLEDRIAVARRGLRTAAYYSRHWTASAGGTGGGSPGPPSPGSPGRKRLVWCDLCLQVVDADGALCDVRAPGCAKIRPRG